MEGDESKPLFYKACSPGSKGAADGRVLDSAPNNNPYLLGPLR